MSDQEDKNKIHDRLIRFARSLLVLKDNKEAYTKLSDNYKKNVYFPEDRDSHKIVVKAHQPEEYVVLMERTKDVIKEYNDMKDFIVNDFLIAGMTSKNKQDIKEEIEENLTSLTSMTNILSSNTHAVLQKDIIFNELQTLVGDLEYRVASYRPYFQSHLLDTVYKKEELN